MVFAMHSTRSFLGFLLMGSLLIVLAPACLAGDEPRVKVRVCVVAVLATTQNKVVDEKLECLAKEVQKKDPSLTGFRLERCSSQVLSVGDKIKFRLVDSEVAEVSIHKGPGKNDRVSLTIKPPMMGEVDYNSCCGKYFPIITRYQTKDHERLIIAVGVHCCDKEKKEEQK